MKVHSLLFVPTNSSIVQVKIGRGHMMTICNHTIDYFVIQDRTERFVVK